MTIKMFKMKQKGLYELVMDNGKVYSFYEEIILKYELLLSQKKIKSMNVIIKDQKD